MSAPAKICDVHQKLSAAGLRPTRQRIALGGLLFGSGDRHVTAEELHAEAERAGVRVSLATVYNTLHQFTGAGLLREVAIEGSKTYFDTNTSDHYHFYIENNGELIDIDEQISIGQLPEVPAGKRVSRVDVLIRLVDSKDE
ncbi:iron response transcriptional regulator IrrA [Dichotomicrobium thermohalophilum]|uniref:Ferric uptake regulation protein n=1 Tax=Dichotomicrobium thermohalophilum TaxID=933063 RepID=A0A397PKQ1_9HYPH|nr:Fur family transcriptional regulator [Dichotomicrobium thermohalophilum]RIA47727.1 Fur family ferric uptake regulator [Dichotomicrobium thermohalophilum]